MCANDYFWEMRYKQDYSVYTVRPVGKTWRQLYRETYLAANSAKYKNYPVSFAVAHELEQMVLRRATTGDLHHMANIMYSTNLQFVQAVAPFIDRMWGFARFLSWVPTAGSHFYYPTTGYLWNNYIEPLHLEDPKYDVFGQRVLQVQPVYEGQEVADIDYETVIMNDGLATYLRYHNNNPNTFPNQTYDSAIKYNAGKIKQYIIDNYKLDDVYLRHIIMGGTATTRRAENLLPLVTDSTLDDLITVTMGAATAPFLITAIDIFIVLYPAYGHLLELRRIMLFVSILSLYEPSSINVVTMTLVQRMVDAYKIILPPLDRRSIRGDRFVAFFYDNYQLGKAVNVASYYLEHYLYYYINATEPILPFSIIFRLLDDDHELVTEASYVATHSRAVHIKSRYLNENRTISILAPYTTASMSPVDRRFTNNSLGIIVAQLGLGVGATEFLQSRKVIS